MFQSPQNDARQRANQPFWRKVVRVLFTREERKAHWGVVAAGVIVAIGSVIFMYRLANVDYSKHMICLAAQYGNHEYVKKLLWRDVSLVRARMGGLTPLHWAVFGGSTETVKILLAHGAEVNATTVRGHTPLHFAAGMDHGPILKLLVEAGARVNAQDINGSTPLDHAEARGCTAVVRYLRRHGGESREPPPMRENPSGGGASAGRNPNLRGG
jgi:ankyrin repeat protein